MPRVVFISPDGSERVEVEGRVGQSILDLAWEKGIDIEGACEGQMACSTCHVIVDKNWFDKLPAMEEEENYMLDLALGLTSTSRLGCQIVLTEALDGLTLRLPEGTRNMMLET